MEISREFYEPAGFTTTDELFEKKMKPVLLVDDNSFNLFTAKNILNRMEGICYETAYNGAQAVEKCFARKENDQFCLILMDCHMPVMDGFEV